MLGFAKLNPTYRAVRDKTRLMRETDEQSIEN
jgi:hypothetical protein